MHVSECPHVSKNHVLLFFLITTNKKKTKKFLRTFVRRRRVKKNQRKETLLELELIEVFVSLNKRPDFLQNQCNHITRKFVLISKVYFKVYCLLFLDFLILYYSL